MAVGKCLLQYVISSGTQYIRSFTRVNLLTLLQTGALNPMKMMSSMLSGK